MRKSKFSEEQIIRALRRLEDGTAADELCRKLGVSQAALYRWKREYAGLGVSELRKRFGEHRLRRFLEQPLLQRGGLELLGAHLQSHRVLSVAGGA